MKESKVKSLKLSEFFVGSPARPKYISKTGYHQISPIFHDIEFVQKYSINVRLLKP